MHQLRKLSLSRFSLTVETLKILTKYLKETDSLEEICLNYLTFRTYKTRLISDIISALSDLQNIKLLDLSNNNLQSAQSTF